MPFNSYEFIFAFLPITLAGFWFLIKVRKQQCATIWLVLASAFFYAWSEWNGAVLLAPSILIDFVIASALLRTPDAKGRLRSVLFTVGIIGNLAFLGYFKYKNFFLDTVSNLFDLNIHTTRLILPLGVSFLTFQKIGFLADVRAGLIAKVRFLDFLFFTTFFPRTIAGPIVHFNEIVPQLKRIRSGELATHLSVGITLFSIGLFKKSFVADQLAAWVSPVFDLGPIVVSDPGTPTVLTAWVAVLAYTFELYFDFSGYSDMALGIARMLGLQLPMNFNSPMRASSIVEFWSRWHMTLTRFLTAYIYTPLVLAITRARIARGASTRLGSQADASAIVTMVGVPTLTTMAISGIWHGAGWQFVVWGILHGVYLTINQAWRLTRRRLWPNRARHPAMMRSISIMLTFASVAIALVFFRAKSVSDAVSVVYAMFGGNGLIPDDMKVLQQLGVRIPFNIMHLYLPVMPWIWVLILFCWVMVLPNSLELLRIYHPAIDYPASESELSDGWTGASLNLTTAVLSAAACAAGVLMLSRVAAFIYWNF